MDKDVFLLNDVFNLDGYNRYGRINTKHVSISLSTLDKSITEMLLDDNTLKYLFSLNKLLPLTKDKKVLLLNRFLPAEKPTNILNYVTNSLSHNHNFYSFLSEAILAILMKDIFNYNLSASVLRSSDTIADSHTGVDSCFYDKNNKKIIMGEAKFYKQIHSGINSIRIDLSSATGSGVENKLHSLLNTASSNRKSRKIILKAAGVKDFRLLSFEEFLELELIFTGFVMHEGHRNLTGQGLYNMSNLSSYNIEKNVSTHYPNLNELNYSFYFFHLPVESKEQLISMIIEKAYSLKEEI